MSSEATVSLQAEVNRLRHELQTTKEEYEGLEQITIGDYILERLAQLGVTVGFFHELYFYPEFLMAP